MPEEIADILERECAGKKGEEFISCVDDVLVKRKASTDLPVNRRHHKEWEHRDDKFLFWLGDDNGQYYFGMKTMARELPGARGPYYGMTKAFTHLNDEKEFNDLLCDDNFKWLNIRNDTYVLAERKPEYVWDSEKGKWVKAI